MAEAVWALCYFRVSLVKPFLKKRCSLTPGTLLGKHPSLLVGFCRSLKKERLPTVIMPGLRCWCWCCWVWPVLEKSLIDAKGMVTLVGFV